MPPGGVSLAAAALPPRKSLGQHFLLDEAICRRISAQAGDLAGRQVIEVGPGPGGLTRALLETPADGVTAIEFDHRAVVVPLAVPLQIVQAQPVRQDGELAVSQDPVLERSAHPTTDRIRLSSRHSSLTCLDERWVERHGEPLLPRRHTRILQKYDCVRIT